jgi:hypothetical protein
LRNKEVWSWRRPSIVLSFRATETIITTTQTQDSFGVAAFAPAIFLQKKKTIWVLALFFFRVYILSYRTSSPGLKHSTVSLGPYLLKSFNRFKSYACQVWGKLVDTFSRYKLTYTHDDDDDDDDADGVRLRPELRPLTGLLFIPQAIHEHGEPWLWKDIIRGKLLICPPELSGNPTSTVI